MRVFLRCLLAMLVLTPLLLAQKGVPKWPPLTPDVSAYHRLVQQYCEMDFRGFQLNSDSWQRMEALFFRNDSRREMKPVNEEPPSHDIVVVSNFQMLPEEQTKRGTVVRVKYEVLGRFEPGLGYFPDAHAETRTFSLIVTNGEIKIWTIDPPPLPHVHRLVVLHWLQENLKRETDLEWKNTLKKSIQQMEAQTATSTTSHQPPKH